jgi:hypothetical protein
MEVFPVLQRRAFSKLFADAVQQTTTAALTRLSGRTVAICMDAATIGTRHVAVVFLCCPFDGTVVLYCLRKIGRTTDDYVQFVVTLLTELHALGITVAGFCTDGLHVQIRALQLVCEQTAEKAKGVASERVEGEQERSGKGRGRAPACLDADAAPSRARSGAHSVQSSQGLLPAAGMQLPLDADAAPFRATSPPRSARSSQGLLTAARPLLSLGADAAPSSATSPPRPARSSQGLLTAARPLLSLGADAEIGRASCRERV